MQLTNVLLLSISLFLSSIQVLNAQTELHVQSISQLRTDGGRIEEATLVVRPQGVYTSVDMYLTFSARGTALSNPSDTLEVTLDFELPNGSIVYDSWLWIDTVIVKADIFDRWTASQIYENIVGRRQDPSILYKNNDGRYQLRIFPMAGNKSRSVKISYLTPAQWTSSQVSTLLPMPILRTTYYSLDSINVFMPVEEAWGQPKFPSNPDAVFKLNENNTHWKATLNGGAHLFSNLRIAYNAPLNEGVYVNRMGTDSAGIYQMVLLPNEVFKVKVEKPKKILFLLEYVTTNGSTTPQANIVRQMEYLLQQYLTPQDSFNLIFSRFNAKPFSNTWLPGDSTTVANTFATTGFNPSANYTSLPTLLGKSIDFIQNNGKSGEICIIANSNQIGQQDVTNELLQDLQIAIRSDTIIFHVVDFLRAGHSPHYINNRTYNGNEYFYSQLTNRTSGVFIKMENAGTTNVAVNIANVFEEITAIRGELDLHTRLEDGICYNRFGFTTSNATINLKKPIVQVGKFKGTFPFIIQSTALIDGQTTSKTISIEKQSIWKTDTLSQEIWSGLHIQALGENSSNNQTILQIIDESLRERVLSRHTAFLCLEPALGGKPCFDCVNEGGPVIVDVDNIALDSLVTFTAAPNPFKNQVKLSLKFAEAKDLSQYQFAIRNMVGQQVKVFNDLSNTTTDRVELTWETSDDVAPGIYFFVIQSPNGRQSLKLVKL